MFQQITSKSTSIDLIYWQKVNMGVIRKLDLKNPLEMFKRLNSPEDRENLVLIFYVSFHKRTFSKISSQWTFNNYGTARKDLAQTEKVMKGGNIEGCFSHQREGMMATPQDRENLSGFGVRNTAFRDLESHLCQGKLHAHAKLNFISSSDSLGLSVSQSLLCSCSLGLISDPLTCCKKHPMYFPFASDPIFFPSQEVYPDVMEVVDSAQGHSSGTVFLYYSSATV